MRSEKAAKDPFFGRIFGWVYGITVGYGYQPARALIPVAALIAIGARVASRAPYNRLEAPSPWILSAHRLIPLISFGENYNKVDLSSGTVPAKIRYYFVVHAILGYVLAGFLVAAVSKLIVAS